MSNKSEQLEFKMEKIVGIYKHTEKVRNFMMLMLLMQNSMPKLVKLAIKKLFYLGRTHDLANSIYINTRICVASKQRIVFCRIINTRSRKAEAEKGHKGHQSCDDVHDQNCARSMRPNKFFYHITKSPYRLLYNPS